MMTKTYLLLMAAIIAEVIATMALARSESFTKPIPGVIVVAGYIAAFWFLSFPIRVLPTGLVYAIWSGMGIFLITVFSWVFYKEMLDGAALVGMAFILTGVVIINFFSKTIG